MKCKFKIGDKVIRIVGNFAGMKKGDIGEVIDIDHFGRGLKIKEYIEPGERWHDSEFFKLVTKEDNEI